MYTAQSRNAADEDSAYVFNQCRITAEPGAQNIYLGRPWRPYSTVIFMDSTIQASVAEAGWREWHPGDGSLAHVTYAEYFSRGMSANVDHRHPLSHQLSVAEAAPWTLRQFFKNDIGWIPR
jgi:pectin methylesterase-like acyl-CoA thioesterase